jgi:mRNA interferase MazF
MSILKRFLEWIKLKESLHAHTHKPPLFKDGEVWWCSIGENVGSEINGKNTFFSRPIIVYRKLSSNTFLAIPTSTQDKKGTWYIEITLHGIMSLAILSQIRVLDYKRLSNKIGQLGPTDFKRVKVGFRKLYTD